jgi:hypothetical protein
MEGDQEGVELGADVLARGGAEILREVNQLDGGGGDARRREKLVRERGAGSRDFISKFFEILTTMARQTYYRG